MIHVLISRYDLSEFLFADIEGVDTIFLPVRKHNNFFHRMIKAIYYSCCDKLYSYYYPKEITNRLRSISQDDCLIVIGEDTYAYWVLSHLCKHVVNKVAYFWNPCSSIISQKTCRSIHRQQDKASAIIEYIRKLGFKMASFDKGDTEKYKMAYFPQFYRKPLKRETSLKHDFFFCGRNKGRKKCIDRMQSMLSQLGTCNFLVIDTYVPDTLGYSDYLDEVCSSRVLCEVTQPGQIGMTIRSMEALFYEKKMITNNDEIRNYDFYNENNIFILKPNSTLNDVVEFLQKPVSFDVSLQNKYSVNSMLAFLSQLN